MLSCKESLLFIQMLSMVFFSPALRPTFMSLKSDGGHNSALEARHQATLRMKQALQNKVTESVSGEDLKSSAWDFLVMIFSAMIIQSGIVVFAAKPFFRNVNESIL